MLQIRNTEEGKSEWNVSGAHIIIPVIDGDLISYKESDKILTSTITLNPLESSDQTILANGLEHSLVVGLDKNLFDTTNYKSDLLIIQNSDLKLLPCNTDLKVAYTLSNLEQEKNEVVWQNPSLKDRVCGSEKAVFELRHILNYDDVDLDKSRPINLGSLCNDGITQVSKTDKIVLIEETLNQEKDIKSSEFIATYNSEIDNRKANCVYNAEVSKTSESIKSIGNQRLFQSEAPADLNIGESSYKLDHFEESVFTSTNHEISYNNSPPFAIAEFNEQNTVDKEENEVTKNVKVNKNEQSDEISDSFPEKNLPLKKKAKMKRTVLTGNSENQRCLLKKDANAQEHLKFPARRNIKQIKTSLQEKQDRAHDGDAKNKIKKQSKVKSLLKKSAVKEVKRNLKKTNLSEGNEMTEVKSESCDFDETKFRNIFDLVDCLRKCRMINTTIWQILSSGLKEIKVDILKEMIAKRKENCSPKSSNYSPQLKAFALVLYFKQPAAFNHLSQVYKNGWPSLNVIKEWKQRINTSRRRNFVRAQSDTKNKEF